MLPIGALSMLRITHVINTPGKLSTTAHYWQEVNGATVNATQLKEVIDQMHDSFGEFWQPLANPAYTIAISRGLFLKGDVYLDEVNTNGSVVGTAGGDLTPFSEAAGADIAYLLQRRTGKRGRRYRGRMFVPGVDETLTSKGRIEGTTQDLSDDLCAFLGANVTVAHADETETEWAARHWTPDQKDAEGTIVAARDFVVVTDFRYVDKLATRKDRVHPHQSIAY